MTESYDIVIIGAGSGGLVVASGASQLGAKVALVEKHKMGGECLNTGCVPSKTLIHSAKVVSLMKRAETFGLDPVDVKFNYSKVIDHVHSVINRISRHDSVERFEGLGCDVFLDGARFESPNEITVGDKSPEYRDRLMRSAISKLQTMPEVTTARVYLAGNVMDNDETYGSLGLKFEAPLSFYEKEI